MKIHDLKDKILHTVANASTFPQVLLHYQSALPDAFENELLFFLKPECFWTPRPEAILDLIQSVFESVDYDIFAAAHLPGSYQHMPEIIGSHYGYINRVSRLGLAALEEPHAALLHKKYPHFPPEQILGGHQILAQYPAFDPVSLNSVWRKTVAEKLASGLYVAPIQIATHTVLALNAFHPVQIAHFAQPISHLVTFGVRSNENWRLLREKTIGDTFPEKADRNSVRGTILRQQAFLAVDEVSISRNFVHLSAGPFEAAFELRNFLQNTCNCGFSSIHSEFLRRFLNTTAKGLNAFEAALGNPGFVLDARQSSLFALTEHMNTAEALRLYNQLFHDT